MSHVSNQVTRWCHRRRATWCIGISKGGVCRPLRSLWTARAVTSIPRSRSSRLLSARGQPSWLGARGGSVLTRERIISVIERFPPSAGHLAALCDGRMPSQNAGARVAPSTNEVTVTFVRDANKYQPDEALSARPDLRTGRTIPLRWRTARPAYARRGPQLGGQARDDRRARLASSTARWRERP